MILIKKIFDLRFLKFGLVGVINTFSGLSIIYFCKFYINLGDLISNLIGYAIGLCISFYLNSRWTFKYKGMQINAILKFVLVIFIAYLLNITCVLFLINGLHVDGYYAQPFGILPYFLFCYLGCRLWVFNTDDKRNKY